MRCSDARKKLSALLDAEGDAAGRDAVARHVDGCPACRAELEALAGADRALELVVGAGARPPAGYEDALWSRLESRLDESTSELADVKALAERAIERAVSQSGSTVSSDLLRAPAVLGHVVLPSPPPRRRAWPAMLGGGAVLAAGVTAFVMMSGRGGVPAPATPPAVETAQAPPPPPPPAEPPAAGPVQAPAAAAPAPEAPAPAPSDEKATVKKPAPARDKPADAPAPPKPAATTPAVGGTAAKPLKKESEDEIAAEVNKPTPVEEAKPTVGTQKLTHDQIRVGMALVEASVQGCRPADSGRLVVVLRLRVAPDGKVTAAEPLPGGGADAAVGGCVAKKAMAARFDAFDGPAMTLKYSFTLEADE